MAVAVEDSRQGLRQVLESIGVIVRDQATTHRAVEEMSDHVKALSVDVRDLSRRLRMVEVSDGDDPWTGTRSDLLLRAQRAETDLEAARTAQRKAEDALTEERRRTRSDIRELTKVRLEGWKVWAPVLLALASGWGMYLQTFLRK
jgi:citrate lyase beta subunit